MGMRHVVSHLLKWKEKLVAFQLNNKFLHCMEPEMSLPYIMLKNKIEILKSLKSGKTDFKDFTIILSIKYFP